MEKYLKAFQKYAQKNPAIISLIVVGIFILVVGLIYMSQYKASVKEYNAAVITQQEAMTAEKEATAEAEKSAPKTTIKKPAAPKPASNGADIASQSYLDALKTYASRRVQLSNCVATPNKMTFSNGTPLMFDNRDEAAIQILLDGKSHNIGALGFKVITLSSATLPHSVKIDCIKGGTPAYNAATVNLQ